MGHELVPFVARCDGDGCTADARWTGVVTSYGGGTEYTQIDCPTCGKLPVDERKQATPRNVNQIATQPIGGAA